MTGEPPPGDSAEETAVEGDDAAAPAIGLGARLGRYDLLAVLGTGGMGVVFEARDPELDRAIAVKILRSRADALDGIGAARLRREGVTMARLTHPNVIRVYDVGVADGHVFVAMELVRGCTLAEWATRGSRSVAEVIAAFVQAGRGLAAAHDAGLVHRDFKPQNVLVGDDGRVLVTDFGLARVVGDDPASYAVGTPVPPRTSSDVVTRAGEILGTPAYMAPEQFTGAAVDARADQFSFCVSLCRTLRSLPGGMGPNPSSAVTAVDRNTPSPVMALELRGVPRAIRRALSRGLDIDPARRFPSMRELLAGLEPRRPRLRWWLAGGAAAAAAIGGAAVVHFASDAPRDPCPVPAARIAAVWSPARSRALHDHVLAIDPLQGSARFDAALRIVDPFARSWRTMHVAACRDTRVNGRQSDLLLDRRMACLDRALTELGETVVAIEAAPDRFALDRAMHATSALPSLEPCGDVAALTEQRPPPSDRAQRVAYDELGREIARLDVHGRISGSPADLEVRAQQMVARARALGHPGLISDALWSLAQIQMQEESSDAAITTLREHVAVAGAAHADRIAALAWTALIGLIADAKHRPEEAEALMPAGEAAVARVSDRAEVLRFRLLEVQSRIARRKNELVRAQHLLDDGIALLDAARAAGQNVSQELVIARMDAGHLLTMGGRWQEAADSYRAVLALITRELGPDHPDTITASFDVGVALRHTGDNPGALAAFREAARIGEARLPPSPRVSDLLDAVGTTMILMGQNGEAVAYLQRAVAMARATLPDGDFRLARSVGDLGGVLMNLKRVAEARPLIEEAVAMRDRMHEPGDAWAAALYNLGNLEDVTGHCDRAIDPTERALAMYELAGKDTADVTGSLVLLADCQVQIGRWRDAIASTDRVLASSATTDEQRALAIQYRDRARAQLRGRGIR